MTSPASVGLSGDDLVQVVDDIVGAFLDSSVQLASGTAPQGRTVTGCVQVTGAFTGAVVLRVTHAFGVLSASRMIGTGADEVDHEAVADTVGELTNMVGGSIKALLPEPSMLSLPVVSTGDGAGLTVPGAAVLASVRVFCEGELLTVSVLAA